MTTGHNRPQINTLHYKLLTHKWHPSCGTDTQYELAETETEDEIEKKTTTDKQCLSIDNYVFLNINCYVSDPCYTSSCTEMQMQKK